MPDIRPTGEAKMERREMEEEACRGSTTSSLAGASVSRGRRRRRPDPATMHYATVVILLLLDTTMTLLRATRFPRHRYAPPLQWQGREGGALLFCGVDNQESERERGGAATGSQRS
jgi:hypothetical protein